MMVWQSDERNEWEVAIRRSLAGTEGLVAARSDAFSLADPPAVTGILEATGFADVAFTDVHEPVYHGQDVAAALDWVCGFACTSDMLSRLDPAAPAHALGRLREMLPAHLTGDGVARLPRLDRQRPPPLNGLSGPESRLWPGRPAARSGRGRRTSRPCRQTAH